MEALLSNVLTSSVKFHVVWKPAVYSKFTYKKKGNDFTQMYSWDCYNTEFNLLGKIHGSIQSKTQTQT